MNWIYKLPLIDALKKKYKQLTCEHSWIIISQTGNTHKRCKYCGKVKAYDYDPRKKEK